MSKPTMDEKTEYLFRGILSLQTVEECRAFFDDLCTIREVEDMSRRLTAARMLKEGQKYLTIAEDTGLSTATICRVNRALTYGSDGYETVLRRLEEQNEEAQGKKRSVGKRKDGDA